jgi:hypothetical protein
MKNRNELILEENRRIRQLRIVTDLLIQTVMSRSMTLSDAETMISGVRSLASKLFPGKEGVFDLIYLPRFRRALREAGLLEPKLYAVPGTNPEQANQN